MTACSDHPAPVLHTRRLRLVPPQARHFEAFAQLHADPDTMRHIGSGEPLDRTGAWLHLAMLAGHWQLRGYGVWALERLEAPGLVGRVGLFHPEGWEEAELNWIVAPAQRRQGLALEAARAARDFAFASLRLPSLTSLVRPANHASAALALRLGASPAETIDFLGGPIQVYRYPPQG